MTPYRSQSVNLQALHTEPDDSDIALADPSTREETEEQEKEEDVILCRNCHAVITRPAERMMVDGIHAHTFANPHGIVFEIGCFKHAEGCVYTGPITDEFSWFRGYRWQIAVCASCLQHMGWIFRSTGGEAFHGLILDHLKRN